MCGGIRDQGKIAGQMDVQTSDYRGYEFHTKNGSIYSIDSEGRLHANRNLMSSRDISLEGSRVEVVQGVESSEVKRFDEPLCYNDKKSIIGLLAVHGKEPKKGRRLLVLLTDEDFSRTHSCGLMTSMLMEDPVYKGEKNDKE